MKTFLYVLHMLVIAGCAFFLGGCFRKKVEVVDIENIIHFHFNYSVGCYMNGNYSMGFDLENGKYIAFYKGDGISEDDKFVKEISKEKVLELENKMKDVSISKWNGFKESDLNVLDGNDFSLYIQREDKKSINASGYEKYPNNYSTVKGVIESFFEDIFKEEIEKQKTTQSE